MTIESSHAVAELCHGTPTVGVMDNRGLSVCTLVFNRTVAGEALVTRITRQRYNGSGHPSSLIDARLFDAQAGNPDQAPNFRFHCTLSGHALQSQSQDAGNQLKMLDIDASPFWQQGSRGQIKRFEYDARHRLSSVHERDAIAEPERISERYVYGDALDVNTARNCRGQTVRRYDTAGLSEATFYTLGGQPLQDVRHFLQDPMAPGDWEGEPIKWQALLESECFTSRMKHDVQGTVLQRVDARGNQQFQSFDVAGHLANSAMHLAAGKEALPILLAISFSAAGEVLQEQACNGVVTTYTYEPQTRRLSRLQVARPAQRGRRALLQDLSYHYDPVGNVLSTTDAATLTGYYNNQRIEPVNTYGYDALYQLMSATGRENVNVGQQGPGLPVAQVPIATDPSKYSPYSRHYQYDEGGNLIQMRHQGRRHYTLDMLVSPSSNRAVRQTGQTVQAEVDEQFDADGNLKALAPGQLMRWNGRNQLQRVAQVVRSVGDDDGEYYQYDGAGARVRKTTDSYATTLLRRAQVRYLPGLELRQTQRLEGDRIDDEEELLVIKASSPVRQQVRVLHWNVGQPQDVTNDQLRTSLADQMGSTLLELDRHADILTMEAYYPYGGTAVWSGKNTSETHYKFVRYSGKELDVTGLYYYGLRYYAAWMGRWLNPDPAGTVDGLNLYEMVSNNPASNVDGGGMQSFSLVAHFAWEGENISASALSNMLFVNHISPEYEVNVWTSRPMAIYSTLDKMLHSEDATYERYLAHRFAEYLEVKDTRDLYSDLVNSSPHGRRLESMYYREKSGAYRNYAAASDITRVALMFEKGGVYLDADVVAAHGLDPLTKRMGGEGHRNFLILNDGGIISNAVLASKRYSAESAEFLAAIVKNTDKLDSLWPLASWTFKRSLQGKDAMAGRLVGTKLTTGPSLLRGLSFAGNKDNHVPEEFFYRRVPSTAAKITKSTDCLQPISDVVFRGLARGVDDSATWFTSQAGRRGSAY